MANVGARLSTSSSTTSNTGDADPTSSDQRDAFQNSKSVPKRPSAYDLYTSSAATASTSSAALKSSHDDGQQAAAKDADAEANSEQSRYLKRKEQNRMAQRRHREKQRQDVEAKRQRTSDSGRSSSPDAEEREAAPSAPHGWTTERVGASSGRKKLPRREVTEAAAATTAPFAFNVVPPAAAIGQHYVAQRSGHESEQPHTSFRPMDELAFTYASNSAAPQPQHTQRSSLPQGVFPDISAPAATSEAHLSFSTPTSGTASTPTYSTHRGFYDEGSHQAAASSLAIDGSIPPSTWTGTAPWGWANAGPFSAGSQPMPGGMVRPPDHAQLPISQHPTQHTSALQSWQNNGNVATSQDDQHRIQRNQEQAMRQFVALVSQSVPWMDHLLSPRWDMLKVLKQAAEQLGLMSGYLEEDESVSFLPGDYRIASSNTISPIEEEDGIPSGSAHAQTGVHDGGSTYPSAGKTDWQLAQQPDPAGPSSGVTVSVLRWTGWPSNMNPSKLSGVVPHHPFLDLAFPWPHLRDKVFAAIACDFLIEKRFCDDVWPGQAVEDGAYPEPPYTVHGDDAFDPAGYEISNRFALRYGPLIDASIFRRTNWWRRQQGKEELPRSILDLANYFEGFFAAQIRHLLQPAHHPAPMRPPVSLPWPLQLLGSGTSMLNGQTQTMPIQELP